MSDDWPTAPDDSSNTFTPRAPSPAPRGADNRATPLPPHDRSLAFTPPQSTPAASTASAIDARAPDRCPVPACRVAAVENALWFGVRAHLRDAHTADDVAVAVLVANRLRGCPQCGALFSFGRSAAARRALSDHTTGCASRPAAAVDAAAVAGSRDGAAAASSAAASNDSAPPPTSATAGGLVAAGGAAPLLGACPLAICGAPVGGAAALVAHLRAAHTAVDVPDALLAEQQLKGCRHCHRLFSAAPAAAGRRPIKSHEPNCSMHPLLREGRGPAAVAASATAAGAATASAAELAAWATRTCCFVPGCTTTLRGTVAPRKLPAHLARTHTLAAIPQPWVTAMRLGGCRYRGRAYRTPLDGRRQTSLRRHEERCVVQRPAADPDTDTAGPPPPPDAAGGATSHAGDAANVAATAKTSDRAAGDARAPPPSPNHQRFSRDPREWARRRASFLLLQPPTPEAWPALVASGARTADHVAASLLPAWRQLGGDALA